MSNAKLVLRNTALVIFDTKNHAAAAEAIERSTRHIQFDEIIVFTDVETRPNPLFSLGNTVITIPKFQSWEQTSVFMLTKMPKTLLASNHRHFLHIQHDGFIVNPGVWNPTWLLYDHIGAPWPDGVVGNDGFCLRSSAFYEFVDKLRLPPTIEACHPGDARLCRYVCEGQEGYRRTLEWAGIKFAQVEIAERFSVENQEYTGQFGFHGHYTQDDLKTKGII